MPHIHEAYDFTISVFIAHDNKVLLVSHPRYGKWLPPGGHIELDEDPEQALFREIQEETGLEVEILSDRASDIDSPTFKSLLKPNYLNVHEANAPHKHIGLVYLAKAKNSQHVLSSEHTDMRWLTEQELKDPVYDLSPNVIFYAIKAIEKARA